MTTTYRCNQCGADCGTRAKITANEYLHFCTYRCAQLYFENSYILYEETDREIAAAYYAGRGERYEAGR